MIDRPMWCDNFDMDLPKIFPDARSMLGDVADIELWTTGHLTNGTLNHPTVWNGGNAMLSFFGFQSITRPSHCFTRDPVVRCTVWEAFKDAWPHGYLIQIECRSIWDTGALWPQFETLMWAKRNWGNRTEAEITKARRVVLHSLGRAKSRLSDLIALCPSGVTQFEAMP